LPAQYTGRRRRRWRGVLLGTLLLGIGAVSGYAAGSVHGGPWWILGAAAHQRMDPERLGARVDNRVEKALSRVDATAEQRGKVSGIAKAAITDLAALGITPWEARGKFVALLRADTLDPAAIEALRAEQIGAADAASKRIVQALTDAASVLTVEQRRELTERWQKRHSR